MFTLLTAGIADSLANIQPLEMVKPDFWARTLPVLQAWGLKLLASILIFIIGKWIAQLVSRIALKTMQKSKTDPTLAAFISDIVYFLLLVFVVIAAIGKLGVQTASFIAIVGAAGLAIGMALQGSLANFAAGVMLILYHPIKVGDKVNTAGQEGTVNEIQMFSTIIHDADKNAIIIPNSKITNEIIINYKGEK